MPTTVDTMFLLDANIHDFSSGPFEVNWSLDDNTTNNTITLTGRHTTTATRYLDSDRHSRYGEVEWGLRYGKTEKR